MQMSVRCKHILIAQAVLAVHYPFSLLYFKSKIRLMLAPFHGQHERIMKFMPVEDLSWS